MLTRTAALETDGRKILTGDVRSTVAQQHHQMNCPLQRHERNCDAATHINQMLLGSELESVKAIWMETSERKITKVTGTTAHQRHMAALMSGHPFGPPLLTCMCVWRNHGLAHALGL